MFYRWNVCGSKKRGRRVGTTKRGKGTKLMAVADRSGLPVALYVESASPHEVTLVEETLKAKFIDENPQRLIGDKAYDSDKLDEQLRKQGIELIAPHKNNRCKPVTQDGRALRRYSRRWKIERLFSWFNRFRRLVVRYEYHPENFLAMVQLASILMLVKLYL